MPRGFRETFAWKTNSETLYGGITMLLDVIIFGRHFFFLNIFFNFWSMFMLNALYMLLSLYYINVYVSSSIFYATKWKIKHIYTYRYIQLVQLLLPKIKEKKKKLKTKKIVRVRIYRRCLYLSLYAKLNFYSCPTKYKHKHNTFQAVSCFDSFSLSRINMYIWSI